MNINATGGIRPCDPIARSAYVESKIVRPREQVAQL